MAPYFTWTHTKQEELAPQLVTIAGNLQTQGAAFGLSAADAATWLQGARVNFWLQTQLIPALRDFSVAATAARDELQLDKVVADFPFPDLTLPPKPAPVAGAAPLQTDFLDWANKSYQAMRTAGLSDSQAIALGFLVPPPTQATPVGDLKPRVTSIDTQAGGKCVVTSSRDGQKMVHCRLLLDTGEKMDKVLANSQFTFTLPTDRVHHFEAMAIYADKNGEDLGQWSDVKSDTSEL